MSAIIWQKVKCITDAVNSHHKTARSELLSQKRKNNNFVSRKLRDPAHRQDLHGSVRTVWTRCKDGRTDRQAWYAVHFRPWRHREGLSKWGSTSTQVIWFKYPLQGIFKGTCLSDVVIIGPHETHGAVPPGLHLRQRVKGMYELICDRQYIRFPFYKCASKCLAQGLYFY